MPSVKKITCKWHKILSEHGLNDNSTSISDEETNQMDNLANNNQMDNLANNNQNEECNDHDQEENISNAESRLNWFYFMLVVSF